MTKTQFALIAFGALGETVASVKFKLIKGTKV